MTDHHNCLEYLFGGRKIICGSCGGGGGGVWDEFEENHSPNFQRKKKRKVHHYRRDHPTKCGEMISLKRGQYFKPCQNKKDPDSDYCYVHRRH